MIPVLIGLLHLRGQLDAAIALLRTVEPLLVALEGAAVSHDAKPPPAPLVEPVEAPRSASAPERAIPYRPSPHRRLASLPRAFQRHGGGSRPATQVIASSAARRSSARSHGGATAARTARRSPRPAPARRPAASPAPPPRCPTVSTAGRHWRHGQPCPTRCPTRSRGRSKSRTIQITDGATATRAARPCGRQ